MSRPIKRFWSALELVPDLAGVPCEWQALLADDHEFAVRFLLPTKRIAGSVDRSILGRTCTHEIRKFKDEYIEVCANGCDTATRSREEVTIHRLNVVSLGREIAETLHLEAVSAKPVPNVNDAWMIGELIPLAGYRFPVCLSFTGEPDVLHAVVTGLAARNEPFILMLPTRSALCQMVADLLKRTESLFLSLDQLIGDDNGRMSLLSGSTAADVFIRFCGAHVPDPNADEGMVFFPTPAEAKWEDVSIRFIDRHSVYIDVQGVTGKYHCTQMGMASKKNAKPTVQWLLLETFAEGYGSLDWRNRKADRKNQKRKETLVANLRRFFRIEGDPFVIEADGWHAHFTIRLPE